MQKINNPRILGGRPHLRERWRIAVGNG